MYITACRYKRGKNSTLHCIQLHCIHCIHCIAYIALYSKFDIRNSKIKNNVHAGLFYSVVDYCKMGRSSHSIAFKAKVLKNLFFYLEVSKNAFYEKVSDKSACRYTRVKFGMPIYRGDQHQKYQGRKMS